MKKLDAKRTMLLHSEAKVEFFRKYLERYLRIIGLSGQFREINIFDLFCGTGVYDNGKKGSPIAAFEAIRLFREQYPQVQIKINLFINDGAKEKVEAVRKYIEGENAIVCDLHFSNESAEIAFGKIGDFLTGRGARSRNLVFVDPYGYKEIDRSELQTLLGNGRTEIILFLPVSHMQRFTVTAMSSDEKPYLPLKKFVSSFFPTDHPIQNSMLSIEDYVQAVSKAIRFGKYYSTSFMIERDASNRYALFFVSPHIYGYEKILEVKWQMDDDAGRGFSQPNPNPFFPLFAEETKDIARGDNLAKLQLILESFLVTPRTNLDLYEHILNNEFLPSLHAGAVLKRWQSDGRLRVSYLLTNEPARRGSFYINYDSYKDGQPAKVQFTLD